MKFYVINSETKMNELHSSSGIEVTKMVNVYKILGKEPNFTTLESLSPYDLIYVEQGNFTSQDGLAFIGKNKKDFFALSQPNQVFQIVLNNNTYWAKIHLQQLALADSIEKLNKICVMPDLSHLTPIEAKAYEWLNSGKTGMSSLTICKTLLPKLKHPDLSDNISYPHDIADVQRCLYFFECVPELENQISQLASLGSQWSNLSQKWINIKELIQTNQLDAASNLINECVRAISPKLK